MTIDLGTGDGRAVLAAARARPDRLAIGVDACAAAMAAVSRRAAARPERGGCPNALFVVAAVEAMPPELAGLADLVTVRFPWGSLLRGLAAPEPATLCAVRGLLAPGAGLEVLLSVVAGDRAGVAPLDGPAIDALAAAWADHGLPVSEARPATLAELAASGSSWGRRLGAGGRRPVWLLRAGSG